jgi:hypothetical protein
VGGVLGVVGALHIVARCLHKIKPKPQTQTRQALAISF